MGYNIGSSRGFLDIIVYTRLGKKKSSTLYILREFIIIALQVQRENFIKYW